MKINQNVIYLTNASTEATVMIFTRNIEAISDFEGKSKVYLTSGRIITVEENRLRIIDKINAEI